MTLHLIKLCVGVDAPEALERWQPARIARAERELGRRVSWHVTRMVPKRRAELLDGGSLYWVMGGQVRARQRLADLREIRDETGRRACVIELHPELIRVAPRAQRPFQGWRYLPPERAPRDLADEPDGVDEMPPWMVAELKALGLL
jgi:hypothetical protein